MEVILLERVAKLGQMGEVVRVKDGFARNFLLPQGKALRATKDNRAKYESMKSQLEARNLELRGDAEKVGAKLNGRSFIVIRQASETGQLYGSVSPRDLAALVTEKGFAVNRAQVALNAPIKTIGLHKCLFRCIPRSKRRSMSPSRATPTRLSGSPAARISPLPARKVRKPPRRPQRRRRPSSSRRRSRRAARVRPQTRPRQQTPKRRKNSGLS